MKYMLMMNATRAQFDEFKSWSADDLRKNVAFMRRFGEELRDSGTLVATEGLAFPDEAKVVRSGHDGTPITDGVFPESKEFLAGYWIVDVEDPREAYEIAARASASPGAGGAPANIPIEVRRIMEGAEEFL
jgi:hypothetical protein